MNDAAELARLREENASLQRLLDELTFALNVHSIVAVTDPRGVIVEVNEQFCEISQYRREELIGRTHRVVSSGRHPSEFFARMRRVIARGEIWKGEICYRAKDGSEYWGDTTVIPLLDEHGEPRRYVAICTEETQRHLAEERARELAYTDQTTGLPNQASLLQRVDELLGGDRSGISAVLAVGIDEYSWVNDGFGFSTGDRLLRRAGSRLSGLGSPVETVGRVGPGTFGLLLPRLGDDPHRANEAAEETGRRVAEALGGTADLGDGVSVEISATIGYATFHADACPATQPPVTAADEVLKAAEIARKRAALSGGRTRLCRFEPRMLDEAQSRVTLASDLRRGISAGQLRLYAQPIVDRDRRVIAHEGLLRWESPARGLVAPADFIPIAEQTGMIVEMGAWVLEEACRVLAGWAERPETAHLAFSVNLSERQLRASDFVQTVCHALETHGAPAERLKLEMTESMFHTDIDRTVRVLRALLAEHVRVSLDDFGTGYSSLSYLRQLPVQQVKIDRSFVTRVVEDPDEVAIVKTIVDLADILRLQVVVEGVETEEQFAVLRELGIDAFQGYLFGRPAPVSEIDPLAAGG
ncbi:EAL domain-containing protein [Leucobacter sp. CSA1]|uniref:EAL domain-containing protein n=1 Tax=Leucobacter chromiisoli TaxID=2796471 RepID=A0A934Q9T5_9MICO|nr:GGDEF domain-containing phosphodiesterase [Leucobacter chromiisoli]MBK0419259.1 EAL domain-containing protein [Leucobacter chromiisoli]